MQILLLLTIILALLPTFPIGLVTDGRWSVVCTAATVAALFLVAWMAGKLFAHLWNRTWYLRGLRCYRLVRAGLFVGVVLVEFISLILLSWGYVVRRVWGLGTWILLDEILLLSPLMLSLVAVWWGLYPAEKILHDSLRRRDSTPFWSRTGYVIFQARTHSAILILPMLLYVTVQEMGSQLDSALMEQFRQWLPFYYFTGISVLAVLVVLLILPWMLVRIWQTESLPQGELRDLLESTARRLGFRYTDFRVWHTQNNIANALVTGILPWPRYVVFSDSLLQALSSYELVAVLGHEIGHVRRWHLPLYVGLCMLAAVSGVQLLSLRWPGLEPYLVALLYRLPSDLADWRQWLHLAFSMTVLWGYIWLIFGYVSRHCEREADVYGCLAASCGNAQCSDHRENRSLAKSGDSLCPTGIRIFISALEKVADINGLPRTQWSWRHGSIARRIAYLEKLQRRVAQGCRWPRWLWLPSWTTLILLALSVGGLSYLGISVF
uniref:Tetratricopeptide repeat domain protein n=1 Tax=uncultured Planctomycetota bacterium TaxID=120965 RepID=H5S892_9BACT|nr:tetratricopeptide repeat domain protein [uncultured Planctomycetota bacterium]